MCSVSFPCIISHYYTFFIQLWLDFFACVDCMDCYQHLVKVSCISNFRNIFTEKDVDVFNTYFTHCTSGMKLKNVCAKNVDILVDLNILNENLRDILHRPGYPSIWLAKDHLFKKGKKQNKTLTPLLANHEVFNIRSYQTLQEIYFHLDVRKQLASSTLCWLDNIKLIPNSFFFKILHEYFCVFLSAPVMNNISIIFSHTIIVLDRIRGLGDWTL